MARRLGWLGAAFVRWFEYALFAFGVYMVAPNAAYLMLSAQKNETLDPANFVFVGVGFASFAIASFTRGLRTILDEVGIRRGFNRAIFFGALTLFGFSEYRYWPKDSGPVFLLLASSWAVGWVLVLLTAAIRNADDVGHAMAQWRDGLNRLHEDGRHPGIANCAFNPTGSLAGLVAIAVVWLEPHWVLPFVSVIVSGNQHPVVELTHIPGYLRNGPILIALTVFFTWDTYVSVRKVGSGDVRHGMYLWILSLGQFVLVGATALFAFKAYYGIHHGTRIELGVLAMLASLFAAWVHRERVTVIRDASI
jgi:hypothetical protein